MAIKIYNTDTNQAVQLPSLIINQIDCSTDIYGNMSIHTGLLEAPENSDCELQGNQDAIDWWTNYGNNWTALRAYVNELEGVYAEEGIEREHMDAVMGEYPSIANYVYQDACDYEDEYGYAMDRIEELRL